MRRSYFAGVLVLFALAGCSGRPERITVKSAASTGPQGDAAAIQACQSFVQGITTRRPKAAAAEQPTVTAGYRAPVGQVNRWRAGREPHGPQINWGDMNAVASETVCFLDANFFDESTPPGYTGVINREIIIIDPAGNATLDTFGTQAKIPVARPTPGVVWPGG